MGRKPETLTRQKVMLMLTNLTRPALATIKKAIADGDARVAQWSLEMVAGKATQFQVQDVTTRTDPLDQFDPATLEFIREMAQRRKREIQEAENAVQRQGSPEEGTEGTDGQEAGFTQSP